MTPDNQPILDYAKPTTRNYGSVFKLIKEGYPNGVRYVLPAKGWEAIALMNRILWLGSAALFGSALLLFVLLRLHRVRDPEATPIGCAQCIIFAILFAIGAHYHRANGTKPRIVEVDKDSIRIIPAGGGSRRWVRSRMRKLRVVHRGRSLETGKPVGDLQMFSAMSHTVFSGLEIEELNSVAEEISRFTGVPISKRRSFLGIG